MKEWEQLSERGVAHARDVFDRSHQVISLKKLMRKIHKTFVTKPSVFSAISDEVDFSNSLSPSNDETNNCATAKRSIWSWLERSYAEKEMDIHLDTTLFARKVSLFSFLCPCTALHCTAPVILGDFRGEEHLWMLAPRMVHSIP
jgi:hypothetical protein